MAKQIHFARASVFVDSKIDTALIRMFARRFPGGQRIYLLTAPAKGVERVEDCGSGEFLEAVRVGGRRRVERVGRFVGKVYSRG